jgi:hypothetical protein
MVLSEHPAERHREIGRGFTDRVRGTRSWDVPSPVAAWTARLRGAAAVRAVGQNDRLDPDLCAGCWPGWSRWSSSSGPPGNTVRGSR